MNKSLHGKTAIITGGGTGIGKSCAAMLTNLGCNTVISYRQSSMEAKETVTYLNSLGQTHIAVQADVTSDKDMRSLVKKTLEKFGRVDILINSAGTTQFIEMEDLEGVTDSVWDTIMNTNVKGAFYASRASSEALEESKGTIVNITSIAGLMGRGSSLPYAVSKGALITLTKALARSLSPNVRVNAVAPGIVQTRWVAGQTEHIQKQTAGTLLQRVATADDIAETVVALITSAGFVTGQTLIVDGGFYL